MLLYLYDWVAKKLVPFSRFRCQLSPWGTAMDFRALRICILVLVSLPGLAQQPAQGSEAAAVSLRGPVHTVETKYFGPHEERPRLSILSTYDRHGYLLEESRYEADGTVSRHTKYTRDGWKVFKTESTSVVPSENRTFIQTFNSDGLVSGTETYDGSGVLIAKTKNSIPPHGGGMNAQTVNNDGTVANEKTVETTDNSTGITRQTVAKDGRPSSDWLIQRDKAGKPVADRLTFADGSFNEREVQPDGTTVEHKYWAPTKTHTYQTTDAQNHTLEVVDDSPSDYTKTTYKYDKRNQTEIANYDRAGTLLRKSTTQYQEDGHGNWIEQNEYHWDQSMGANPPKLGEVNRRFITYY